MACVDLALTTDAPLLFAPAVVAAGALLFAATDRGRCVGDGAQLQAPATVSDLGLDVPASSASYVATLVTAPPPAISAYVDQWLRWKLAELQEATAGDATRVVALIAAAVAAGPVSSSAELVAEATALEERLFTAVRAAGVLNGEALDAAEGRRARLNAQRRGVRVTHSPW